MRGGGAAFTGAASTGTAFSGAVSIKGAEHIDAVKTVSGSIDILESRLRERAELSLVGGRVTIRDVSAPAIELKGVSGGLELRIFVPVFGAPLRFIYASNLDPLPNDNFESFQFSIGSTF